MVGQPSGQAFAVNSNTQYLRWVHGVPTVVQQSNLAEGDQLVVAHSRTREARRSPQVEASAAKVVADHGPNPGRADGSRSGCFQGTLNAPAANGHLGVHVLDGNHRALKGDARPGTDPVVRLRAAHGVHQWTGPRARRSSPSQLHRRRPDQRPDPRPRQLVARTGRVDAGEATSASTSRLLAAS